MQGNARAQRGFTLIELSIVLVIIGLIVGGILAGQDLIHAAQIRSVLTDIEKFNTAALTFQGKYACLPGDCSNATSFFGAWTNCGYGYAIPAGRGTCNGNGDGKVVLGTTGNGNYWAYDESMLFWHHLSLAALIKGNYSGATDSNGLILPGVDVPTSSLDGGCLSIDYSTSQSDSQTTPISSMNSNIYSLGNAHDYDGGGNLQNGCGAGGLYSLPAAVAHSIDAKIDDGLPFSGIVQTSLFVHGGYYNYSGNPTPGCTNGNYAVPPYSAYSYAVSAPATACALYFKAAF